MIDRDIFVFENSYRLTDYLVSVWLDYAKSRIQKTGKFSVALSGGKTPVEFYCKLSNIDQFELWRYTDIFLADERFVPIDHDDSSARMIKENLINYIFIEPHQFHPIRVEGDDPVLVAEAYENDLKNHFNVQKDEIPSFDLILLGIGEDGHTAALFSESDLTKDSDRLVTTTDPIHLNHKRVSLTMPVINNAKKVICIVTGKRKADILYKIIEKNEKMVASEINPKNGQLIIMADRSAAEKLLQSGEFNGHNQDTSIKKL